MTTVYRLNGQLLTHAFAHWLADVHSGSFAPAFTLSFHDSECSRKWNIPSNGYRQMPKATVVSSKQKKERHFCNLETV